MRTIKIFMKDGYLKRGQEIQSMEEAEKNTIDSLFSW